MELVSIGALRIGGIVQVNGTYNVGVNDFAIDVVTSGGAGIVNLPAPSLFPGRVVFIKKIAAANTVTINASTIEATTSYILYNLNASVILRSDGAAWRIYATVQDFGGANPGLFAVPAWLKFTVTHTALQAAALTNNIELFSLPAGGVIHATKIKHSTIFAGAGITDYKISLGLAADLVKYGSLFDVDTAVTSTNFQLTGVLDSQDNGAVTSIKIAAQSTGANLSASTGGVVEIGLLLSLCVLP